MILVTGGAGLLGSSLIDRLLQDGHKVKAIYNKTAIAIKHSNLVTFQCDILDVAGLEEAMQGVTHVYHCAGMVSFHPKDVQKLYKINVEGTANIVNIALEAGVQKMIHVSSVAALGRIRENQLISEKMHWTPETSNSRYGESKHLGEMEVWRGIAEGLNAVIVNPTIILGAGNWNESSTAIFRSVYNEFPWYTDGTTGFVDVKDVVTAMVNLMNSEITGERFIISGHNDSYQNLFNSIADAFGKKRPRKQVTAFLSRLVTIYEKWKCRITGVAPLVTKETAATAMAKVNFDNSKLLQYIPGFVYTPLQQTITETCRALQHKLNNQ